MAAAGVAKKNWGWWYDAACRGDWVLFDATDPISHHVARAVCARCPVFEDCQLEALRILREPNGSLSGTWAGRLYTPKSQNLQELRRLARACTDAL